MAALFTVYAAPEKAFLVNSFIIETDNGVVLIDSQFLLSPAREVRELIEKSKRPLKAIVITHPHPDHFGGTSIIMEGQNNVPVYATQATQNGIRATESGKREFWAPIYGNEYPNRTYFPDHTITSGASLVIDGLEMIVDDLGAGESSDITVVYFPRHRTLIASDLIYNHIHPWLAEGRSEAWLKHLDLIKTKYKDAEIIYPGHGSAGTLDLFDQQKNYILSFQDMVRGALVKGGITPQAKAEIITKMKVRYPSYPMENLIDFNIDGVASEFNLS